MFLHPTRYYKDSERDLPPKSKPPFNVNRPQLNTKFDPLNAAIKLSDLRGNIPLPNLIFRALSKMTFGATPELVSYVQSLPGGNDQAKLFAYIDEQLNPGSVSDTVLDNMLANNNFTTLNKTRQQLYQDHIRRPDGGDIEWDYHILPSREVHNAVFARGVHSNRQVFEMMVDFWHNHFNVFVESDGTLGMWVNYDRIMRTHAFGNFRDFLQDMTESFCMGSYLGNAVNEKEAPNENFARELLELHTIGAENYFVHLSWDQVPVDGQGRRTGYVEEDVLELARALTGWSFSGASWWDYQNGNVATGMFVYRDDWHDKDPKRVMGQTFTFNQATPKSDVEEILDMLCEHPATATFLAQKMCKRFISDNPPQNIIDQVADALHQNWQAPNQIQLAMEVLLKSSAFLNTWGEKVKRPFERTVNSMRQMKFGFDWDPTAQHSGWLYWSFRNSGQAPFMWASPNGYPDEKGDWLGASSMMQTWRYMQWLSTFEDPAENKYSDIVNETIAGIPDVADHTANGFVDYWFQRLCGVTPDNHTQDKLAQFMSYNFVWNGQTQEMELTEIDRDTLINITTAEELGGSDEGSNEWPNYNRERLRALVAMICMTAEFNYR